MANRFSTKDSKRSNRFSIAVDTVKGIPRAFSEVIGQPALRSFAGIASAITGKPFKPTGRFQQDLYGTDKPITLGSVGKEFRGGIGGDRPRAFDPAIGLFAGLADTTPTGRQVKGVLSAADELVTPVSKLIKAIRGASAPRKALESAYTAERAVRASKASEVFQGGQKGYFKALGQLKGELAQKPQFTPIDFAQGDVDGLFSQVQTQNGLDFFEKLSASNGLQGLLEGKIPPKSQLSLLEDVFGKDLIVAIREKRPLSEKLWEGVKDVLNIPRSLITSVDMSAPLRQGVLFTVTKPRQSVPAVGGMFQDFFSAKHFDRWLADIPSNPRYQLMKNSKLYIANPNKISGGLGAREESFMSNIAERIPVLGSLVRASSRAYIGYLNKLRVDVFSNLATKFEKEGVATPENMRALADFVNNATGRGSMGKLERAAENMNTVFFSPRLIASRFNMLNPLWYAKQPPAVRKEAVKTFAEFVGVGATILAIAKAGGAEVELNPTSSDFGKIRVGDVRWDMWGGFQQWVRVFSQIASGQRKTISGETVKLDKSQYPFTSRKDVADNFLRGKLAPVPSLLVELLEGQKLFGEELSVPQEIYENTIPLYLQDMDDAIKELGIDALFTVGLPAFFGVGVQTYKEKKSSNRFSN